MKNDRLKHSKNIENCPIPTSIDHNMKYKNIQLDIDAADAFDYSKPENAKYSL